MQSKKDALHLFFQISIAPGFEEALRIAGNKHDIAAIKVYDPFEQSMPDIGLVKISDSETGAEKWVDTSSRSSRIAYQKWWEEHMNEIRNIFKRCGVDSAYIGTGEDYVKPLIKLFESR